MKGRVLIIAGSDPSGGAGAQADIKTVTALKGYAAAAITALTVQNTRGVFAVSQTPPRIIRDQIKVVLEDIGADAVKVGMIGDAMAGEAILEGLHAGGWTAEAAPLILDPVLVATSGDALASGDMAEFLRRRLLPMAHLATPNIPEAEALTGVRIAGADGQEAAARALLDQGARAALVKGGHLGGDEVRDLLITSAGPIWFRNPRLKTRSTHGTGCTLASAAATGLAQGLSLEDAVARAIAYVHEAIRTAPGFGAGHGPLNHAHTVP
jgi:hydroxymethylpyrimidine/phosphomethylpyrimidine kinase